MRWAAARACRCAHRRPSRTAAAPRTRRPRPPLRPPARPRRDGRPRSARRSRRSCRTALGTRRAGTRSPDTCHEFRKDATHRDRPSLSPSVDDVPICDLVLPCRDEGARPAGPAAARPGDLLGDRRRQRLRATTRPPSRGTSGARVVTESTPGYGAAVHAGIEAATADFVAVMDGDGSFDPDELVPLLAEVASGRADLAVGRRRPVRAVSGPGTPGRATRSIAAWLRRRIGMQAHDIAPMRVCRRQALLDLGVEDRRFGYPVELLQAVDARRLAAERARRGLPPARRRAPGRRCPARSSARLRTARDFCEGARDEGAAWWPRRRSPARSRPGWAPRIGDDRGRRARRRGAARHPRAPAAAAGAEGHLSLAGDLRDAVAARRSRAALAGWTVSPQRGDDVRRAPRPRPPRRRAGTGRADRDGHPAASPPRTCRRSPTALHRPRRRARPGRGRRLVGARAPRPRASYDTGAGARCRPTRTYADTRARARAGRCPRRDADATDATSTRSPTPTLVARSRPALASPTPGAPCDLGASR